MRGRGINFDTGFLSAGTSTREPFDPAIVKREMRIIRDDLHCNAVRITGGDPARLETAANYAAEAGLEVWFCPFINGLTQGELLALLIDCAERAERLRKKGAEVVFLTGSELSLFTIGFFPGDTLDERPALITDPLRVRQAIPKMRSRLSDFLREAVSAVRARFGGKVSYASLPHEGVDWWLFDIIATDAGYRTRATAARFGDYIRAFVTQGKTMRKPVAITEFGCPTFRGAAEAGGTELTMIEWGSDGRPVRVPGDFVRDEHEEATYIRELLDVFEAEGIDSAFVYTFARYDLPHRDNPTEDFDLASRGIVKVLDGPRQPARYSLLRYAVGTQAGLRRARGVVRAPRLVVDCRCRWLEASVPHASVCPNAARCRIRNQMVTAVRIIPKPRTTVGSIPKSGTRACGSRAASS